MTMKVVIVSGYFNPLHGGHLDMIESARALGDKLIVIVNNDRQQLLKKGKIILSEVNRLRLMRALKGVDEVVLSMDDDPPVIKTLEMIAKNHPGDELIFANGGDRNSEKEIPEADICRQYGIKMVFGVGTEIRGLVKPDSSTRINQATGQE
jgi:glycerol-3-phosphate cytidylyltransferase/D-beta-D-heptose 7-phosphate kinase/D-beta-D-heptose 1-phosphate adenosyltransferase